MSVPQFSSAPVGRALPAPVLHVPCVSSQESIACLPRGAGRSSEQGWSED